MLSGCLFRLYYSVLPQTSQVEKGQHMDKTHNHTSEYQDLLQGLAASNRSLREHIPEVFHGYAAMSGAAMADGAFPRKVKELIALAMGVTARCDGCIASHARGAAKNGATRQEVAETLGIAVMMNGGPGTVYVARAWDAYLEFAEDTQ